MYDLKRAVRIGVAPAPWRTGNVSGRPFDFSRSQTPAPLFNQVDLLPVVGTPEITLDRVPRILMTELSVIQSVANHFLLYFWSFSMWHDTIQ